jgi:hypothetical protein
MAPEKLKIVNDLQANIEESEMLLERFKDKTSTSRLKTQITITNGYGTYYKPKSKVLKDYLDNLEKDVDALLTAKVMVFKGECEKEFSRL